MSSNVLAALLGWLLALVIFCGFIVLLRYLDHRERMALIERGLDLESLQRRSHSRRTLRAGLITMMVGLALTFGLYPLGFMLPSALTAAPFHLGPWLLPGLIPLGVGAALVASYYLEQDGQPPRDRQRPRPPLLSPPESERSEHNSP
ncbi:DUF6249 domain-containing protein [Thermogemmatispora sp.]|uniref:DUF6249 domain-containing protein n=1 Tax=Thermogemmatispora sp. TaxID=1968838 RepID=UPI001D9B3865|nr:DUF6249 domain-containing protein [Thermogemmatispora sp.]MBX5451214.1 hypothetical protein [Thermogemmatispora sp.]